MVVSLQLFFLYWPTVPVSYIGFMDIGSTGHDFIMDIPHRIDTISEINDALIFHGICSSDGEKITRLTIV